MKPSVYIYLLICSIGAFGIYKYFHPDTSSKFIDPVNPSENDDNDSIWEDDDIDPSLENDDLANSRRNEQPPRSDNETRLEICRKTENTRGSPSSKHRGASLISNSADLTDLILCPGDTFGDMNGTYVTVQDCNLTMYHQGDLIWSSNKLSNVETDMLCAISLQRDGNLVVYNEDVICFDPVGSWPVIWPFWDSKTDFHPHRTELRIQNQQLQLVHTLQDGSERMFYAGETFREFREDLGVPKQIAKEFLVVNHTETSEAILKRNEYIGDLNNIHLILQTNCELQLKNKTQVIWSFADCLIPGGNCTFSVQESFIGILKIPVSDFRYDAMSVIPLIAEIIQSNITFQGQQLLIIQTWKNGSEITFYSEPGQDNGLKLKRELTQIAKNNMTIASETLIRRMNYIGDLDGLHLILQDNCHFKLANGQQDLWKAQQNRNNSLQGCYIEFSEYGKIIFHQLKNHKNQDRALIFGKEDWFKTDIPTTQFQLLLENNMMIMTLQYQNSTPQVYHAGANTNGTWFKFLSAHPAIVKANDTENLLIPEMTYIGDINGVYAILDKKANLILYNKTQVIWESRTTREYDSGYAFVLTRSGDLAIIYNYKEVADNPESYFWCTKTSEAYKQAQLVTNELLVNDDGLWLVHTYADGVVMKYKALEGTTTFTLVSSENKSRIPPFSQIEKN